MDPWTWLLGAMHHDGINRAGVENKALIFRFQPTEIR